MATAIEQASYILRAYWGSTGPDKDLRRQALRDLKLGKPDIEQLMDELPPPGTGGDTGQRISECYRFLERLASA